jgi:hypothetical protein
MYGKKRKVLLRISGINIRAIANLTYMTVATTMKKLDAKGYVSSNLNEILVDFGDPHQCRFRCWKNGNPYILSLHYFFLSG